MLVAELMLAAEVEGVGIQLKLAKLASEMRLEHGNLLKQCLVLLLQPLNLRGQHNCVARLIRLHVERRQALQRSRWWFLVVFDGLLVNVFAARKSLPVVDAGSVVGRPFVPIQEFARRRQLHCRLYSVVFWWILKHMVAADFVRLLEDALVDRLHGFGVDDAIYQAIILKVQRRHRFLPLEEVGRLLGLNWRDWLAWCLNLELAGLGELFEVVLLLPIIGLDKELVDDHVHLVVVWVQRVELLKRLVVDGLDAQR